MNVMNTILPFASSVISFIFAFLILKRYVVRRGTHLFFWGIGMIFYGVDGFCEGCSGVRMARLGFSPMVPMGSGSCGSLTRAVYSLLAGEMTEATWFDGRACPQFGIWEGPCFRSRA